MGNGGFRLREGPNGVLPDGVAVWERCRKVVRVRSTVRVRDELSSGIDSLFYRYRCSRQWGLRRDDETSDAHTVRVGLIPVLMFPVFGWVAVRSAMYFAVWWGWVLACAAIAVLLYGGWRYLCVLWWHLRGRNMVRPPGGPV